MITAPATREAILLVINIQQPITLFYTGNIDQDIIKQIKQNTKNII